LSLGFGAALKSFPFLLAPFLILLGKNLKEKTILAVLVLLPYIISIVPYLPSADFRTKALFAPQMDKIFFSKINLSGGEAIYINIFILIGLYLIFLSKTRVKEDFLKFSASALLLILAFTHFHIQWFLWVTPFLVILFLTNLNNMQKLSLGLIAGALVLMLFLFEASLQVRLFAPLIPSLNSASGPAEVLISDSLFMLKSLASTIFAAGAVYFSSTLIFKNES
jgi:hypothetical protein